MKCPIYLNAVSGSLTSVVSLGGREVKRFGRYLLIRRSGFPLMYNTLYRPMNAMFYVELLGKCEVSHI